MSDESRELFIDVSDGNFFHDSGRGVFLSALNRGPVFAAPSFDILQEPQKPCYLSILMSRKQLQTILDNRHLFDVAFVNAAYLLENYYNNVQVDD